MPHLVRFTRFYQKSIDAASVLPSNSTSLCILHRLQLGPSSSNSQQFLIFRHCGGDIRISYAFSFSQDYIYRYMKLFYNDARWPINKRSILIIINNYYCCIIVIIVIITASRVVMYNIVIYRYTVFFCDPSSRTHTGGRAFYWPEIRKLHDAIQSCAVFRKRLIK